MEELIFGSLIVWALGRITKKKAESAPGRNDRTAQATQTSPGSQNTRPVGPTDPTSGAPGGGRPGML
jgi:hypothetical protein